MSEHTNAKAKTILLVDDDLDYCEVTRLRLESAGYQVVMAHNGEEALTLLKGSFEPDLVIMDTCMPVQDGIAALINLNLRANQNGQGRPGKVPVLVATGLESARVEEIARSLNANDFLQKPYGVDTLISKVKSLIG